MDKLVSYGNTPVGPVFTQPNGYDISNRDNKLLTIFTYDEIPIESQNWKMQFVRCMESEDKYNYYLTFCQLFDVLECELLDVIINNIMYLMCDKVNKCDPSIWNDDTMTWIDWWLNTPSANKDHPLLCCEGNATALMVNTVYGDLSSRLFVGCADQMLHDCYHCDIEHVHVIPRLADVLLGIYIDPKSIPNINSAVMMLDDVSFPIDFSYICYLQTLNTVEKFYPLPIKKALFYSVVTKTPKVKITMNNHDHPTPAVYAVMTFLDIPYMSKLLGISDDPKIDEIDFEDF